MLVFVERSKRGGFFVWGSKRFSKANGKFSGEHYNKDEETSYITYVDAKSLFPTATIEMLPYKDIKFENITSLKHKYG